MLRNLDSRPPVANKRKPCFSVSNKKTRLWTCAEHNLKTFIAFTNHSLISQAIPADWIKHVVCLSLLACSCLRICSVPDMEKNGHPTKQELGKRERETDAWRHIQRMLKTPPDNRKKATRQQRNAAGIASDSSPATRETTMLLLFILMVGGGR